MTFFVRKQLALGPIRFGVSPRQRLEDIDDETPLSTGPNGEFIRYRGGKAFFFGDIATYDAPSVPRFRSLAATPFWQSLKPDGTPRGYGFLALMALGLFLVLLGLSVVVRKGAQGWVEVIAGLAMIATPIVLTAQQRKAIRDRENRERAEREAIERRNRELLGAYATALDRVRQERSPESLQALSLERGRNMLPYDMWAPAARRATLLIGFDELAKHGVEGAPQVSRLMSDIARSAGLTREDEVEVKADLYRTLVWHLLANDRLGTAKEAELAAIRSAFGLHDDPEKRAVDDFARLRGLTVKDLPEATSSVKLGFQEHAIHATRGSTMQQRNRQWVAVPGDCTLVITNKRLILAGNKQTNVALPLLNDVDVDIDDNVMTLDTAAARKPFHLRVEDAIYAAALIELAASVNQRPKGFA